MIRRIVTFIVISGIVLGVVFSTVYRRSQEDQYGEPVYLNTQGSRSALIVYFPGLSSIQKTLITSFSEGLAENDWSVDVYYSNEEAPKPEGYDLLVVSCPSYGATPAPSMSRYLERVSNLAGIDTVVITSAAGNSGLELLVQDVNDRGGNVVMDIEIFTLDPKTKETQPEERMLEAARTISN